jgi:hypothetical protein
MTNSAKVFTLQYQNKPKFSDYQLRAKTNGIDFELTKVDFERISNEHCHYCNAEGPNGIDRRDNRKGYLVENCLPCCKHCNYSKGALTYGLFISWLSRFKNREFTSEQLLYVA